MAKSIKKRLADPDSSLWRNKADKVWRDKVQETGGRKCAVCGATEFAQAHHLIPREMYSHRHLVPNGIILCPSHHKYSFILSAHKAPVAFFRWLITNKPETWDWLTRQEPSKIHTITFKERAEPDKSIEDTQK